MVLTEKNSTEPDKKKVVKKKSPKKLSTKPDKEDAGVAVVPVKKKSPKKLSTKPDKEDAGVAVVPVKKKKLKKKSMKPDTEDAGVAIEPEGHLLSVPYKDLTTEKMLKAELNMRRLSTTGKPQELVDRLLANDIIKEAKDLIQLSLPPASPLHSFGCHDVIAGDGYTYDRDAIQRALDSNGKSPMTNQVLRTSMLTSNRSVKCMISDWKENNMGLKGIENMLQHFLGELITSNTSTKASMTLQKIVTLVTTYDIIVPKLHERVKNTLSEWASDESILSAVTALKDIYESQRKSYKVTQSNCKDLMTYTEKSSSETKVKAGRVRTVISDLEAQLKLFKETLSSLEEEQTKNTWVVERCQEIKLRADEHVIFLDSDSACTEDKCEAIETAFQVPKDTETDRLPPTDHQRSLHSSILCREGISFYHGSSFKRKDRRLGQAMIEVASEQGDLNAAAVCLCYGWGTKKNVQEALRIFKEVSSSDCTLAQFMVGQCYDRGEGLDEDKAEAIKWYEIAAKRGEARGQCAVGVLYNDGEGVCENKAEAVKWYKMAADQGDADGRFNLAVMYDHGQGVCENKAEAVKWYKMAADQGDADGQFNLGFMYDHGEGVEEDKAEAIKWYKMAADQGHARGIFMCQNVGGVDKDKPAEGMKWYKIAAHRGRIVAEQGRAKGKIILNSAVRRASSIRVIEALQCDRDRGTGVDLPRFELRWNTITHTTDTPRGVEPRTTMESNLEGGNNYFR